eukprot:352926-Chlamydomonas_euryale.AAC.12
MHACAGTYVLESALQWLPPRLMAQTYEQILEVRSNGRSAKRAAGDGIEEWATTSRVTGCLTRHTHTGGSTPCPPHIPEVATSLASHTTHGSQDASPAMRLTGHSMRHKPRHA